MARHRNYKAEWERPSREQKPAKMCPTSGKRMYASEAEARATAGHRMADKESGGSLELRTYLCVYCQAWHLTSKGR